LQHQCMIYDGAPSVHLSQLAVGAAEKLAAHHRVLFLNSPPMVAGFRTSLAATGVAVADQVKRGALVLTSSQEHLDNGRFDSDRMLETLKQGLEDALRDGYAGLWATGDMMWELGSTQNFERLLEYECGLEALLQENPQLCGVCQYRRDGLPANALQEALFTHPTVFVNSTLSRINPFYLQPATLRLRHLDGPDDHLAVMLEKLDLPVKN